MYGQTGSGKTFTMMGPRSEAEASFTTPQLPQGRNSLSGRPPSIVKMNSVELPKTPRYEHFNRSYTLQQKTLTSSSCKPDYTGASSKKQLKSIKQPDSQKFQTPITLMIQKEKPNTVTPQLKNGAESFGNIKNNPENETGILTLSLKDIFAEIEKEASRKFFLKCSYLEIYNDLVYDLLNQTNKLDETLSISEDHNKEFVIKGAVEEIVTSYKEILEKIQRGECKIELKR